MKNKKLLKKMSVVTKIVIVILTISMLISIFFPNYSPVSQEDAASWINSQKYGKSFFVLFQTIQVIIPPISHYFTSILGGYLYGPIEGGSLNWLGRVIGQIIAYFIAYKIGDLIRSKFFDLTPFEKLVGGGGKNIFLRATIIFAMIALPFFPDDELSYAMGLARFPIWIFLIITLSGHLLGSYALAFLGSGNPFKGQLFIILASVTVITFIILVIATAKMKIQKDK